MEARSADKKVYYRQGERDMAILPPLQPHRRCGYWRRRGMSIDGLPFD
jgi:hypothetical protein